MCLTGWIHSQIDSYLRLLLIPQFVKRFFMAYTQQQLNAINEAIAIGATTVKYGDKEITYRSLSEMKRIKAEMETDLGIGTKTISRKFAEYGRGFE